MSTNPKYYLEPVDFDPFADPEIELLVPLSKPQEEIWLSCKFGGEDASRAYNESVSLQFHGDLDHQDLEKALQDLILRHQSLRSNFKSIGTEIIIYKNCALNLFYKELSDKKKEEQQACIKQFLQEEAHQAYDLEKGPLFRTTLFKLAPQEHEFVFSAHHIICDGWSLAILLQDLGKLYSAYQQKQKPDLPQVPQMGRYVLEQLQFAQTKAYQETEQFWLDQFKEKVPVTHLPLSFPRPAFRTYQSKREDFKLSNELTSAIKKTGAKKGCSFVVTLLSAFEVLLHQLTQQQEIVLGLPAAGQAAAGYYGLTGHCVNLLPIKSVLKEASTFNSYLQQRKTEILDVLEHQQFSLGTLLKTLAVRRDPSRIPLVPVVFNVDLNMDEGIAFKSLSHRLLYHPRAFETFEIFLNASGSERDLTLEWSYNTQLFNAEKIGWMMKKFEELLQVLTQEPDREISSLQPLAENKPDDQKKLNPIITDYPQVSLAELISLGLKKHAVKTAIRFHDQSISNADLLSKSNQLAALLLKKGTQKGDLVAVALDRSIEIVVTLLAVLKSGATYVPMDPTYPQERIRYMLQDSGAKLLVVNKKYQGNFIGNHQELILEEAFQQLDSYPAADPKVVITGHDLAYVLYTSGSTGNPKGVEVEHRNVVNLLHSIYNWPGVSANDKVLAISTISFDIAGLELFLPLINGAEMILADTKTAKDGYELLKLIQNTGVTLIQATPPTFRMLLEAGWKDMIPTRVFCCGEALPQDLAQKLLPICTGLWNMYGPTETTVYSTGKQITNADELITIGKPINNTQIYILDEALDLLPEGATGEIFIAGEGVAKGYLNQPELTAARFPMDKFSKISGQKMYRTGDVGRILKNGEIEYLGRTDHQVKVRGYRIELGEIEQQLSRQENVRQSVVVVNKDQPGNPQLVAYVVASAINETLEKKWINTWKTALKEALPYYMLPAQIIILPAFPLTPNQKVDRNALPKPPSAAHQPTGFTGPKTAEEKLVSEIWHEVLCIKNSSIYDNFFEIGGHSLVAIQLMNRIEKETGKRLPLATLFESSTIATLAKSLSSDKKQDNHGSLIAIKSTGNKIPLYLIHGSGSNILNFSNISLYVDAEQPVYGLQARGLNGNEEPLSNLEEIAKYYIEEVVAHNPTGPYALAGYSFGGYVAVEMARQLRLMGKEIKMLAMIDTNAEDQFSDKSIWYKVEKKILRQFKKSVWITASLLKQPKATINYQLYYLSNKIKQVKEYFGFYQEEETDEQLQAWKRIAEQNDIAYYNYKIKPFDGTIDLFKARKRIYFVDDFKFLGWKKYALKGVNVHVVPGDHKTMLQSPNDKELAKAMQNCLNQSA